jgi:hypothetical protein
MTVQPPYDLRAPEDDAALRSAEELVAAGGHEGGAGTQPAGGVRLAGQHRVRSQETGPDVGDDRNTEFGQLGDARRARESGDAEVGRVDLQQKTGFRADRPRVVPGNGSVGGTHLAQPSPGRHQQVREAEAVADLHHLAPADDDLLPGRQRRRGQDQSRRTVVHHVSCLRSRHPLEQSRQCRPATSLVSPR